MPALSASERDPIKLADWIELKALYSSTRSYSLEGVRTRIDADGTLEDERDGNRDDTSESLLAFAMEEMERRESILGSAYPFKTADGTVSATISPKYMPYIFNLLVSDREFYSPGDQETARLFEHLVRAAVENHLGCRALRFGARRDTMPPGIRDAITELSAQTGLRALSAYPVNNLDQDLGLDVVAWKEHSDKISNTVLFYIQCATGQSWTSKKFDCNFNEWRGIFYYFIEPIRALAIPYTLSQDDWDRETPGVYMLDRLRIAACLRGHRLRAETINWWGWCISKIREGSRRERD